MALPTVVVEECIADEFVGLLKKYAQELTMGPAYEETTALGPLVSAGQKKFVVDMINKGVEEGAELVLDGRGVVVEGCEGGYFVGPTIFDNVKPGYGCRRSGSLRTRGQRQAGQELRRRYCHHER